MIQFMYTRKITTSNLIEIHRSTMHATTCQYFSKLNETNGNTQNTEIVKKNKLSRKQKMFHSTSPDVTVCQGASSIHLTQGFSFSRRHEQILRITNTVPK